MSEVHIKQGESLRLLVTIMDDSSVPVDLSSLVISSQVRSANGDLVAALSWGATAQGGVATAEVMDTSQWPIGLLRADLKVVESGFIIKSETFAIRVNRAVTQ